MKKTLMNVVAGFFPLSLLAILFCVFACDGLAQDVAIKPDNKAAAPAKALPPKLLTDEQKKQIAEAQRTAQLARANFEAAQAKLEAAQSAIDGLILKCALDLGADSANYNLYLQIFDEKKGEVGFLPKVTAPPAKP